MTYLPSSFSFLQSSQCGFPPVPDSRLLGGISFPGPHLSLSWYLFSFFEWNEATLAIILPFLLRVSRKPCFQGKLDALKQAASMSKNYEKETRRCNRKGQCSETDGQRPRTGTVKNKRQLESGGQVSDAKAKTSRRLAALKKSECQKLNKSSPLALS